MIRRIRTVAGSRSHRGLAAALVGLAAVTVGTTLAAQPQRPRMPLDDRLAYKVSWLGIHCGEMTLESAPVEGKPALVQLRMTVRSTDLFDSVYRVRAEIESIYNLRRGSTLRFHERSSEQDKTKDDLWVVALESGKAQRTVNGKQQTFELPPGGALDPLAMLYRVRSLAGAPGEEFVLTAMTTSGSLETRASVERWERFETATGEVTALKVVQDAVGDDDLGRGGSVTMWLGGDSERTPYRIEFDLPFGTLVAARTDQE